MKCLSFILLELIMILTDFYWKTYSWLEKFSSTLSFHFVLINPRVPLTLKYTTSHSSVLRDTHFPFLQSFLRADTFFFSTSWIAGVYNDESCWYDFQFCMRVTLRYLRQFCLFLFFLCFIYSSPFFFSFFSFLSKTSLLPLSPFLIFFFFFQLSLQKFRSLSNFCTLFKFCL